MKKEQLASGEAITKGLFAQAFQQLPTATSKPTLVGFITTAVMRAVCPVIPQNSNSTLALL